MADSIEKSAGQATLSIDIASSPENAGAELKLFARVVCSPPCETTGLVVTIRDADGSELGQIELSRFDGETTSSDELVLQAPLTVGPQRWTAVLPEFEAGDVAFPEATAAIDFEVTPHAVTLNAWGLASALTSGAAAQMHVGARCSCGCSLAGRRITIHDAAGQLAGEATLGEDVWPSSEALYFAEAGFTAAGDAGLHEWQVRFEGAGMEPEHADSAAPFGVRIVAPAEHVVKIEAVDEDGQTPLAGAIVTMHPFRTTTDERGVAEIHVPKGTYRLFVSARRYVSSHTEIEVQGDVSTRARLAVEIRPERL